MATINETKKTRPTAPLSAMPPALMARRGRAALPTLAQLPASREALAAMVTVFAGEAKTPALRGRLDLLASMLRRDADQLGDRICRGCGCSDWDPCEDGHGATCWWIEDDLCSCCHDDASAREAEGGGGATDPGSDPVTRP